MFTHADQGNLSGFCNRRLWNFSNCVADLEWLRKWGVHKDLYWFGPPKSSTLHPVHDVVLFTLICSRGYRWVREVAWSQVSVVCRSHVWLKVEGEREREREGESPSWGSKRKKSKSPLVRSPYSPFYKTRGAGYIIVMVQAREREREKESECTWSKRGVREELFTHVAGLIVPISCCCCCVWLPVLVMPLPTQVVEAMNAFDNWYMHGQWGFKTTREDNQLVGSGLAGVYVRWWPWFLVVFPHRNKS
jgi:hypothetical protein